MLKNYWKVALRSLLKRKGFTLINILGLAMGMAVCMLILLFIRRELSYDRFEAHGDRIYRMVLDRKYPGRVTSYAIIPNGYTTAVKHELPEVEASTGLEDFTGNDDMLVKIGDRRFEERHVFTVGLLSKDFIRLVSISAIVAFPVAWLAMHAWLQSFVYRVALSWWIFVLAWLLCLLITLITISFQAIRAAATNPVKVLRSE